MDNIYTELKSDHRQLEKLMDQLVKTEGDSDERATLFSTFSELLEKHSHAEERAFYAPLLQDKNAREKTAHGIKEHCDAAALLDELKELSRASGGWLAKMKKLREEVLHHIKEEEGEMFAKAKKVVAAEDAKKLAKRFEEYKAQE